MNYTKMGLRLPESSDNYNVDDMNFNTQKIEDSINNAIIHDLTYVGREQIPGGGTPRFKNKFTTEVDLTATNHLLCNTGNYSYEEEKTYYGMPAPNKWTVTGESGESAFFQNMSLNCTPAYHMNYSVNNIFSNSDSSKWMGVAYSTGASTVILDLGHEFNLGTIKQKAADAGTMASCITSYSTDGVNYTELYRVTKEETAQTVHTFGTVRARYIKWVCTSVNSHPQLSHVDLPEVSYDTKEYFTTENVVSNTINDIEVEKILMPNQIYDLYKDGDVLKTISGVTVVKGSSSPGSNTVNIELDKTPLCVLIFEKYKYNDGINNVLFKCLLDGETLGLSSSDTSAILNGKTLTIKNTTSISGQYKSYIDWVAIL